jgi:hypothetical protein
VDWSNERVAGLKGQAVAFGARGSGLPILARYVLDGRGLDQERDFKAVFLDQADASLRPAYSSPESIGDLSFGEAYREAYWEAYGEAHGGGGGLPAPLTTAPFTQRCRNG